MNFSSKRVHTSRVSKRMAALARLEFLNDPSSLDAILMRIATITAELLPVSGGASIILWDDSLGKFYECASTVPGQHPERVVEDVRNKRGATRWIVDHHEPFIMANIINDPFGANPMLKKHKLRAYAGFPLIADREAIGVLYALDSTPRDYSQEDLDFMQVLAQRAAKAVTTTQLFIKLEKLATHDELTGIYNRRGFLEQANHEFNRAQRFQVPLSVLMIDIDHFKNVNDSYGHKVGDHILVEIARRLRNGCRDVDVLGRIGGEEFAILLAKSRAGDAYEVAERLRNLVGNTPFETGTEPIEITISVGVASFSVTTPDIELLLHQADTALYRAKEQGRNSVNLYRPKPL